MPNTCILDFRANIYICNDPLSMKVISSTLWMESP